MMDELTSDSTSTDPPRLVEREARNQSIGEESPTAEHAGPEGYPPAKRPRGREAGLLRIEWLAHFLDNSIPVPLTNYRVGWDAFIGLIPAAGEVAGLILSVYIILEASRFKLPGGTLRRMVFNVVLEFAVGAVPLFGDLFDAVWKSNARNLDLLRDHLGIPRPDIKRIKGRTILIMVFAVLLVLAAAIILLFGLVIAAVRWVVGLI